MEMLDDPHLGVQGAAIIALSGIAKSKPKVLVEVIPDLIKSLRNKDSKVRGKAVFALGIVGRIEPEAFVEVIPDLIRLLGDKDSKVRGDVADVLVESIEMAKSEIAVPVLIETLENANLKIRKHIMHNFIGPVSLIKPEFFNEETLLILTKYDSDEELRYITFYSTKRVGKPIENKNLEDIVSREIRFDDGKQKLSTRIEDILKKGPKKVLVVHNIKDGLGDELIRIATLTQAILDYNPEIEVTIYTGRDYLYDNERVKVKSIEGKFEEDENFDMVIDYHIDYYNPGNQRYSKELERIIKPWIEKKVKPRVYLRANKATDNFVYEKIEVDGKEIKITKGRNNVYDPIYRLSAEFGLPFKVKEEGPRTLIVGKENPASNNWWEDNVIKKNVQNKPIAVLNGFGGQSLMKGYIVISQYANAIKDLIDQGYFVVITPNGVEGGKEKDANAVVDLLDKKDKQFITITPEPQDSPKLLKHVVAKSDLIVTVEGGLMHLAYNLGKPLFALQMRGSGDFSKWLSYARSDKQKTITTGEDFAERIGERKVEEKPATEKPVVEEEPVTEIEEAAKIELEWWEGKRDYIQDEKDIARMLENGELIRLKDGGNYKISPAMKFKLATSEINSFIEQIADEWVKELENQGIKAGNKLMITNAARTTEYQKELISEGYHAAERSSHTLGVAFDVADKYFPAKWFNPENFLEAWECLLEKMVCSMWVY